MIAQTNNLNTYLVMLRPNLSNIIDSMELYHTTLRTLRGVSPRRDRSGRLLFNAGRKSIIFSVDIDGEPHCLKCYTSTPANATELFALLGTLNSELLSVPRLLPEELFVAGHNFRGYIDVAIYPHIEGNTLDYTLRRAAFNHNTVELEHLAHSFTRLALDILSSPWRHGDLKPENIIVCPDGQMRLIDLDALYHPTLSPSGEVGTVGYVHPLRGKAYDSHIDDYSIALIGVALYALAIEPTLIEQYPNCELIINPNEAIEGRSSALAAVVELFDTNSPLRTLATTLATPNYPIASLKELLQQCIAQTSHDEKKEQ